MKIAVLGLWHLGAVTAACAASVGHDVFGIDFAEETVAALNAGKAPLFEPGLDDLLRDGLAAARLRFSTSVSDAADADVLWVTYDTPVDDNDDADVDFVLDMIERVLPELREGATILISSQMPVGSVRRLEAFAKAILPDRQLSFAYSPENLRLGKAIDVFLNPDRIVVGVRHEADRDRLSEMFGRITERIEWMSVESAEMTKHAINAFLAVSVTFVNEIAAICERVGADAKDVERGLKTEQRIGPKAYLSPGGPIAGGTLARDIQFLNKTAAAHSLVSPLLSAVKLSNDEHKNWACRRLLSKFSDLSGQTIAIWGLTYKPGTNTLRRSSAIELCRWLLARGAVLRLHDPAVDSLPGEFEGLARRWETPLDAATGAVALVVATEWPLYREVDAADLTSVSPGIFVVDASRFARQLANAPDIDYVAVGTPMREI